MKWMKDTDLWKDKCPIALVQMVRLHHFTVPVIRLYSLVVYSIWCTDVVG